MITCPDIPTGWHVMSALEQIASRLERLASQQAKIRIQPPAGKATSFEIELNDLLSDSATD